MENHGKRFMLPGDRIGTSEEYIAGEGTFESEGTIFASTTGYLDIDLNEMIARIRPATSTPVLLKPGNLIFGAVHDIRGTIATIRIAKVIGKDRAISSGETMGTLHISKVTKEFLQDIGKALRVGDYIRAKVTQVEPSLQLTTQDEDLGVITANCIECSVPLKRKGKDAECPQCEKVYHRKLAGDFGSVEF